MHELGRGVSMLHGACALLWGGATKISVCSAAAGDWASTKTAGAADGRVHRMSPALCRWPMHARHRTPVALR
eukprot:1931019-Prymnesium_polylepis.1